MAGRSCLGGSYLDLGPDMKLIREAYIPSCCASASLADLVDRERHFQKRALELALLLREDVAVTCLSAQYPSGNQTYSYPSRGGRGGSTPNFEAEVDKESTLCLSGAESAGEVEFVKAPSRIALSQGVDRGGSWALIEGGAKVRSKNGGGPGIERTERSK